MRAATSPLPVAGCPTAPTSGRWSPSTRRSPITTNGSAAHEATASFIRIRHRLARAAAGARRAGGGAAGAQGGLVGNEDGAHGRHSARYDHAALHRRHHRQADEQLVLTG